MRICGDHLVSLISCTYEYSFIIKILTTFTHIPVLHTFKRHDTTVTSSLICRLINTRSTIYTQLHLLCMQATDRIKSRRSLNVFIFLHFYTLSTFSVYLCYEPHECLDFFLQLIIMSYIVCYFACFLNQSIDISIEYLLYLITTYVLYTVLCYYAIANIGYRFRVDRTLVALLLVIYMCLKMQFE